MQNIYALFLFCRIFHPSSQRFLDNATKQLPGDMVWTKIISRYRRFEHCSACLSLSRDCFLVAIAQKNNDFVRHMIELRLPWQFYSGATPLHYACLHGHVSIVRILLENGFDPSTGMHKHYTILDREVPEPSPLKIAVDRGHTNIVRMLADHSASIDSSILPLAITHNNLELVMEILALMQCSSTLTFASDTLLRVGKRLSGTHFLKICLTRQLLDRGCQITVTSGLNLLEHTIYILGRMVSQHKMISAEEHLLILQDLLVTGASLYCSSNQLTDDNTDAALRQFQRFVAIVTMLSKQTCFKTSLITDTIKVFLLSGTAF